MDMQAYFEGLKLQWAAERAASQLTLGGLIDILSTLPREKEIEAMTEPHSYRGYYEDLAFELSPDNRRTVADTLEMLQRCMGKVFEGYKGGDFPMHANTPIWSAYYGCCGRKLVSFDRALGTFETAEDE